MYIRRTLSCCICHVFHSVFSLYVHLMYISLSLFFVDGFYCVVLLDIVLICCCTPDNDVDSPSPDMGRHSLLRAKYGLSLDAPLSFNHKQQASVIWRGVEWGSDILQQGLRWQLRNGKC